MDWNERKDARKAYVDSLPSDARKNLIEIIEESPVRRTSNERKRLLSDLRSNQVDDHLIYRDSPDLVERAQQYAEEHPIRPSAKLMLEIVTEVERLREFYEAYEAKQAQQLRKYDFKARQSASRRFIRDAEDRIRKAEEQLALARDDLAKARRR